MKRTIISSLLVGSLAACEPAFAQEQAAAPPLPEQSEQPATPSAPPPAQAEQAPLAAPPTPPPMAEAPPPAEAPAPAPQPQWVYQYPTGQWVYMAGEGWVWVPAGSTTTAVEGVPYSYLYTPLYGWTWYVSPWGWGPYAYGPWIRHPWLPVGWRAGWVAGPRVMGHLGAIHPAYGQYRGYASHGYYRGGAMGHGGGRR